MHDSITKEGIRLRKHLKICADEFRLMRGSPKELREHDAKTCEDAAALIQKLDIEVFRLRQTIGCYLQGVMDRSQLRHCAETWNGDKKE